ncbi:MAG TPA: glycosyltransferase family 2 protein [Nitrospirota bacterium]|nr:glycosyltransferase family 2 protein [Nitrospirota bacterium]
MTPKVSVCMPTFNSENFLSEAIESVLKQSYTDFELIVSDDCSSDETVAIAKRYAEIDRRIKIRANEQNVGQARNLNLCLQHAKGEYIKFVFSDDVLVSKDALKKMVAVLDDNDEIALVASARYVIDGRSNVIDLLSEYRGKIGYCGSRIIQDCLVEQSNRIGEPTVVLFRKKHSSRGFDVRYKQTVDLEMWAHLLEQGNFAYINEPLCAFRLHGHQETSRNLSGNFLLIEESIMFLEAYADKPYIDLSRILRGYMGYVPVYSIWKLYKKGRISRQEAIEKIRERYNFRKFVLYSPLFRLFKLLRRYRNQIRKIVVKASVSY